MRLQQRALTFGFDACAFDLETSSKLFRGELAILFGRHFEARVAGFEVCLDALETRLAELDRFEQGLGVAQVDLVEVLVTAACAGDIITNFIGRCLEELRLGREVQTQGGETTVDPLGVDRLVGFLTLLIRAGDVALEAQLDEFGTHLLADLAENRVSHVVVDRLVEDGTFASMDAVEFRDSFWDFDDELHFTYLSHLFLHTVVVYCCCQTRDLK